ncbi:MAG: hypothetical protein FWE80_00700 [Oscillospiraceae bacterium]|nr:hypothetical protein [Oscillospiraceae bacterium]
MQKLMYINNDGSDVNENKYVKQINDLLEEGWKIIKISCANVCSEGDMGGFVVLEKKD